jgi:AcrR family transcriptional regulator
MAKRSSGISVVAPLQEQGASERAGDSGSNETRERILEAAHTLFRERGYDGTAMSQLADRAGVTTPALYWHFSAKAEICSEVLRRDYEIFLNELTDRAVGATPEARLRAFTAAFVELQLREIELERNFGYRQLRQFVTDDVLAEITRLERDFLDLLKSILKDGQEQGDFTIDDLTTTAHALTTMCENVFTWFQPGGRLSAAEVGSIYANLAAGMVHARTRA